MKSRKYIYFLILVILIIISLSACYGSDMEKTNNANEGSGSGVVREIPPEIPPGFVYLENNLENGLHYIFWEDNIVFLDSEDVNIYQIGINEDTTSIIIEYEKNYYFNEEKLKDLIKIAGIAPEIRSRTYSLHDIIDVRGWGDIVYSVKIASFEAKEGADISTYTIKRVVTSNSTDFEKYKFITSVETKNGVSYSTYNDWVNENTLSIKISGNEKLGSIILSSPDFPGLTYRIVVSE